MGKPWGMGSQFVVGFSAVAGIGIIGALGVTAIRRSFDNSAHAKAEIVAKDMSAHNAATAALAETEQRLASKAKTDAAIKADEAKLRGGTLKDREASVKWCAAQILGGCGPERLDAMIRTAADEKEVATLRAFAVGVAASTTATKCGDALERCPLAGGVADMLATGTPQALQRVEKGSLLEAKKDSDSMRGKRINVDGRIVSIRKSDLCERSRCFEGLVATDGGNIVSFLTPFPTPGIVDGTRVSLTGIFLQEWSFPNVAGGQTRSTFVIGALTPPG